MLILKYLIKYLWCYYKFPYDPVKRMKVFYGLGVYNLLKESHRVLIVIPSKWLEDRLKEDFLIMNRLEIVNVNDEPLSALKKDFTVVVCSRKQRLNNDTLFKGLAVIEL